jgi:hypothetical protein
MASVEPFASLDVSTLNVGKPRANQNAGKSSWIDRTSEEMPKMFTLHKDARLLWAIRPGSSDGTVKANERLNMEVALTPEEEAKARECDDKFISDLYTMKVDFFGASKAKAISSKDALKPMYKTLLREGGERKDGGSYDNSMRLKVDGWADWIESVNVIEKTKPDGEKLKITKDCTWRDRLVEPEERNAPTARDTRFMLFIGINPASGKPRYTDKVPVQDASGRPVVERTDATGKPVFRMRYVGPQDAVPGSQVTVVWSLSKLYLTETTGPIAVAKQVFIKPAARKPKAGAALLDDVELDDGADAGDALAALTSLRPADDGSESAAGGSGVMGGAGGPSYAADAGDAATGVDDDAAPVAAAAAAAAAAAVSAAAAPSSPTRSETGRKRKAASAADGTPVTSKKSKTKTVALEDDF